MNADVPSGAHTEVSTVVCADVETVMGVIADFDSYPQWAESIRNAQVLSRDSQGRAERVRFELDAGQVTDIYVLRYSWADDGHSVSWQLEDSTLQRFQKGSYYLSGVEGGTAVRYELEVELLVPIIGRVRSRAERRIIGSALSELQKRAEGEVQ